MASVAERRPVPVQSRAARGGARLRRPVRGHSRCLLHAWVGKVLVRVAGRPDLWVCRARTVGRTVAPLNRIKSWGLPGVKDELLMSQRAHVREVDGYCGPRHARGVELRRTRHGRYSEIGPGPKSGGRSSTAISMACIAINDVTAVKAGRRMLLRCCTSSSKRIDRN